MTIKGNHVSEMGRAGVFLMEEEYRKLKERHERLRAALGEYARRDHWIYRDGGGKEYAKEWNGPRGDLFDGFVLAERALAKDATAAVS